MDYASAFGWAAGRAQEPAAAAQLLQTCRRTDQQSAEPDSTHTYLALNPVCMSCSKLWGGSGKP